MDACGCLIGRLPGGSRPRRRAARELRLHATNHLRQDGGMFHLSCPANGAGTSALSGGRVHARTRLFLSQVQNFCLSCTNSLRDWCMRKVPCSSFITPYAAPEPGSVSVGAFVLTPQQLTRSRGRHDSEFLAMSCSSSEGRPPFAPSWRTTAVVGHWGHLSPGEVATLRSQHLPVRRGASLAALLQPQKCEPQTISCVSSLGRRFWWRTSVVVGIETEPESDPELCASALSTDVVRVASTTANDALRVCWCLWCFDVLVL